MFLQPALQIVILMRVFFRHQREKNQFQINDEKLNGIYLLCHLDPFTNQCELEVQRIIYLQNLANQLPDTFIDIKKVTKSHILAANTPTPIDVLIGQLTNEFKIRLKCGRLVGLNDVTPWKRRTQGKLGTLEEAIKMTDQSKIDKSIASKETQMKKKTPKEAHIEQETPEEVQIEQTTPKEA